MSNLSNQHCWCIYKHTLKQDGRVYIGQTNDIKGRWKPANYKHCVKFYNAILHYGWDSFDHTIIADNLTLEEANALEEQYIAEYDSINNGFNLQSGGLNHLHSEETKQKMSQTRKGVPHSKEHCEAISQALKGYKQTEQHKTNNRLAQHRKPVMCIETNQVYDSLAEAQRQTGILAETISRQIRGKQQSTKGLHWRWVDEQQ